MELFARRKHQAKRTIRKLFRKTREIATETQSHRVKNAEILTYSAFLFSVTLCLSGSLLI